MKIRNLLNGKLWQSFGVTLEEGQGAEWFLFDAAKGGHLEDNIGYLCFNGRAFRFVSGKFSARTASEEEMEEKLEDFLFQYFFGDVAPNTFADNV